MTTQEQLNKDVDNLLKGLNDFKFGSLEMPIILRRSALTNATRHNQQHIMNQEKLHYETEEQQKTQTYKPITGWEQAYAEHEQEHQVHNNYSDVTYSPSLASEAAATADITMNAPLPNTSHLLWLEQFRTAVHTWLDQQRDVLRLERLSIEQQLVSYQIALVGLQDNYDALVRQSDIDYQRLEREFESVARFQQLKISQFQKDLTAARQAASQSREPSSPETPRGSNRTDNHLELENSFESIFSDEPTPSPQRIQHPSTNHDHSLTTAAARSPSISQKPSRRTFIDAATGHRILYYSNGARKERGPDGYQTIHFANGDIETTHPNGTVTYYFFLARVTQTKQPDGTTRLAFANGQVEQHDVDGSVQLLASPRG
jgi:hypothetical protein